VKFGKDIVAMRFDLRGIPAADLLDYLGMI
jgi:hypothetical protein